MIFDTHVHLNDNQYENDLEEVIDRAIDKNVMYMNVIGWDKESSLKAIEVVKKYNGYKGLKLIASVGLHPENIKEMKDEDKDLKWLYDLLDNKEYKDIIKAVGEIGMDLYWDKSYTDLQIEYFKTQIEIACKYDLPIVIHSREATEITLNIIKEYKNKYPNLRGVFHCFSGSIETANELIKRDFMIGVGGVLTFKNSKLPESVSKIDSKYIISETDAPYLPPVPFRGKRNEPSYIVNTINKINEIKCEDTSDCLFNNACKLFNVR